MHSPDVILPGLPDFSVKEYAFSHSMTHLQGKPTKRKYATGLIYDTTFSTDFGSWTSAVVVNNPSPTETITVGIEFYDLNGVSLSPITTLTLGPNETHVEAADELVLPTSTTPSFGSAFIGSNRPVVGSVLLNGFSVQIPTVPLICADDTDDLAGTAQAPGASAYHQMQMLQGNSKKLVWGPIPMTNISPVDFLNGVAPLFWVMNPSNNSNTLTVRYDFGSSPTITKTVVLPPRGTLFETDLWVLFHQTYQDLPAGGTVDDDVVITVTTNSNLPILGTGVLMDIYFDDGADNLLRYERFRMASMMLPSHPKKSLVLPMLSETLMTNTVLGVVNAGNFASGPIEVQYFDRDGAVVASDLLPSLSVGASYRIGPGFPDSPNYPATVDNGWARIRDLCGYDLLTGWGATEIEPIPSGLGWPPAGNPSEYQYYKAFGVALSGCNGKEPGGGTVFTDPDFGTYTREVASFVRVNHSIPIPSLSPWWSGFTTFVNDSNLGNINEYAFRYMDLPGAEVSIPPLLTTYPGLLWGYASRTYDDDLTDVTYDGNASGRVDRRDGSDIDGINVLGDPFGEFGIPGFSF